MLLHVQLYFSQKQPPLKMKSRFVIRECAGYIFWQLVLRRLYIAAYEHEMCVVQLNLSLFCSYCYFCYHGILLPQEPASSTSKERPDVTKEKWEERR